MLQKRDTIAFDFDGVIHRYSKGWEDGKIYDTPVNGIKKYIDELRSQGIKVVIFTTRAVGIKGTGNIKKWLRQYDISVDEITNKKPIAKIYVDDRAINFNGNVKKLETDILKFKPWTETMTKECPVCGKTFIVSRTTSNRKKYCSKTCRIFANRNKEIAGQIKIKFDNIHRGGSYEE